MTSVCIRLWLVGAVLRCPPSRANVRGPRCRVLQYVHDFLTMGCENERNLNSSRWVMSYVSKKDLILNAMVGFHDLNDL